MNNLRYSIFLIEIYVITPTFPNGQFWFTALRNIQHVLPVFILMCSHLVQFEQSALYRRKRLFGSFCRDKRSQSV